MTRSLTRAASLALILAACSALMTGSQAPPVGEVHFGRSFDTTTFEVRNRVTSVGLDDEFAMVGRFRHSADQNMNFEIERSGDIVYTEVIPLAQSSDVYGVVIRPGALPLAEGVQTMRFRDAGGNELASGRLTVTP